MKRRYGTEEETLLKETIGNMAREVSGANLKLADYLRVMQLTDDLDEVETAPVRAGWVSRRQCPGSTTDE